MVDPDVVDAVRELLGPEPRRVLVTGGTGFVGSRVSWLLAEAGQQVTVAGRNRRRLGRAWHAQSKFMTCDITDAESVDRVCREQDAVIHAAALTALWGPREKFDQVNVQGTRNVAQACLWRGLRLVHVSSTAIYFEFQDKLNVADEAPLLQQFACDYAASKAAAEGVIRETIGPGLNAVIVRARAVFGPGDNSLLPRLLRAARAGRLPQIGHGQNQVDLTYVDNLAYGLCLAIVNGQPGSVATITNEQPVPLWPTLERIFARLELPTRRKRVSYYAALSLAKAATKWHAWRGRQTEPSLTPYSVGLLAKSQTFSPAAARRVLSYQPLVPLEDGITRTLDDLTAQDDGHASTAVEVTLFTTGYTPQPYHLAERGQPRRRQPFHAVAALIRHPQQGLYLFDTGYSPRFLDATRKYPYRIYGLLSPVVVSEQLTLRSQLAERGISAEQIRGIIISHFHADHVAGLRDFPTAEFIASDRAWQAVAHKRGMAAVKRAFLPSLLPDDFATRVQTIEHFHDPGIGPFERTHDLFGDGSVRLIELSGHATGQIGALLQTGEASRMLLAADATWTLGSLRASALPHPLTYSFVDSVAEMRKSLTRLHAFSQQYRDVDIVPTHCPEIAARCGFDEIARRLGGTGTTEP